MHSKMDEINACNISFYKMKKKQSKISNKLRILFENETIFRISNISIAAKYFCISFQRRINSMDISKWQKS